MNRFSPRRIIAHSGKLFSPVIALLLLATEAWAQPVVQGGAVNKSYVLPYLMVTLVVALGLAIVLRPSGRATEVKLRTEE